MKGMKPMLKNQMLAVILEAAIALAFSSFGGGQTEFVPMETVIGEATGEEKTVLEIGSMSISLPGGWRIEERTDEEGRLQCVLMDVHTEYADEELKAHREGYEHEIVITPYEVLSPPESPLGLIAEIRAYFSVPALWSSEGKQTMEELMGTSLWGSNVETEQSEYFIISRNATGGIELFHVREDASSLTTVGNDIEAFWQLIHDHRVQAAGKTVEYTRFNKRSVYYILNSGSEKSMLIKVMYGPDWNQVTVHTYRMGNWGAALSEQILPLNDEYNLTNLKVADIDGDGWEDFYNSSGRKVVILPDGPEYEDAEHPFSGGIWNKDKQEFICTQWDDLLWEEDFRASVMKHPEDMIPQGLIDFLSEHLLESREELAALLLPLVSDRNLTKEEIKALADKNDSIKRERQRVLSAIDGADIWLMVDGDNDGYEDIVLCEYLGGSSRPVYFHFFKGNGEGDYKLTSEYTSVKEEFGFLSFEGKNYLAQTTWDFGKKVYDGIRITFYQEGIYQGGVALQIVPKQGQEIGSITTDYLKEERMEVLAEDLHKLSVDYVINREVSQGTAEQIREEEEYNRVCDIDNDGTEEYYDVHMWYTSNYYTVDYLVIDPKDQGLGDVFYNMRAEEEGNIMGMWVAETEFGNVTYLLYEDGLYDFHICGYLISKEDDRWEWEKLTQVTCKVQTEVITEPYHPYTTNQ